MGCYNYKLKINESISGLLSLVNFSPVILIYDILSSKGKKLD